MFDTAYSKREFCLYSDIVFVFVHCYKRILAGQLIDWVNDGTKQNAGATRPD